MKMLFVSNFYPPNHLGGYEMLCHEVATHLSTRGHQVTVLTSNYGTGTGREQPGVHRILRLDADIHYYRPHQVLRHWTERRSNRKAVEQVMVDTAPDVVVVWGMWKLSREVATWVEELAGARVAYYISDQWPAEPSSHRVYWDGDARSTKGRIFKAVLRIPVRLALPDEWQPAELELEHVMVCSGAVRDKLLKAGAPVSHAKVIYHGIDPLPYREAARTAGRIPGDGNLGVVYVGSLLPQKGVHTAIEAFGRMAKSQAALPMHLTILGKGHPQYEDRLRQLVMEWHLDEMVSFHQPIPRSELPAFLARFEVLVMPSVYEEPQARISQEAMAAGLVLVATLTGGTKEILVAEENGLAFEPEDASGLASHLQRLAEEPELHQKLAEGGWNTVAERFTIERMIDELEDYLACVATSRRRPR